MYSKLKCVCASFDCLIDKKKGVNGELASVVCVFFFPRQQDNAQTIGTTHAPGAE